MSLPAGTYSAHPLKTDWYTWRWVDCSILSLPLIILGNSWSSYYTPWRSIEKLRLDEEAPHLTLSNHLMNDAPRPLVIAILGTVVLRVPVRVQVPTRYRDGKARRLGRIHGMDSWPTVGPLTMAPKWAWRARQWQLVRTVPWWPRQAVIRLELKVPRKMIERGTWYCKHSFPVPGVFPASKYIWLSAVISD